MASVMQGDAYNIPVTIKSGNGTLITPEIAACVEIAVGQFAKRWPGQVTFDEKTGEWQFPVTQKQTFRFAPGAAVVQARVVFQDGSIMGGSGAPVSVVQSASRGTLPQPEKTEAATESAPKATEVTIPTVHDINVSLHSQVILSDPIKAPYIGDNGNWYEYDAETGEFVDTGVKAGGGTDPSLGLTGATIGQIIKVKAVGTDGKPTAWKAVDDRLPNVTTNDDGKVLAVRQIAEFEAAYVLEHMPNLNDFIDLGITNASPGQFARVKYVDDVGKPTAWEAVDMPTGGGGETWEKIAEIELRPDTAAYVLADFATWRKAKVIMTRPQFIDGLNKNVWCKVVGQDGGDTYNCGYLTTAYGYVFWEFSAEVNELFIATEALENNNVKVAAYVKSSGTFTPPKSPVGIYKFELSFVDTSVIQEGDKVTVIGVRR